MSDDTVPSGTFDNATGITNDNATNVPSQYQVCQHSGFKVRVRDALGKPTNELVKQWDGLWVHRDFRDKRNPQDYIRTGGRGENHGNKRPEPDDTFVSGVITGDDL